MSTGAQQLIRGRFEVLEEIGEGGFARVYLARETTTGQRVALKVLKDGFQSDKEVMERFRREVFAVASINSPHVVGLRDFGISGDEFFIAMEFVEGPTLRDVIDQHEWSADSVHTIIGQVASALQAAHAQNIVHRDLKPENVMLVSGPDDTMLVKVLDFGLAKLAELERNLGLAPLTRVGMCFGTPQYMSPELIYGKPVDKSVDLFALAVMSYEMIAGRRPWDGAAPQEVMVAVVKTPAAAIARTHSSMMRRLEPLNQFFRRALAKKREERFPDAATLFDELSRAIYGEARPLVVPSVRETTEELSAIHMRLPARPRSDETQIDMAPAVDDGGGETKVEIAAMPRRTGFESNRSSRLQSVWIQSIASSPSIEERVDVGIGYESPLSEEKTHSQPHRLPHSGPIQVGQNGQTRSLPPYEQPPRSRWLIIAVSGGLVLLLVIAATVGFLIGRGR